MGTLTQLAFFQYVIQPIVFQPNSVLFIDHGQVMSQQFGAKSFWIKVFMRFLTFFLNLQKIATIVQLIELQYLNGEL